MTGIIDGNFKVNEHKSKVVHFRRVSDDLTAVDFNYSDQELKIVPIYIGER